MSDTSCYTVVPPVSEPVTVPCELSVAGSGLAWGIDVQTVANPCVGGAGSMLFITVADGPAEDQAGEQWQDPPGATLVAEYDVGAGDPFPFQQRVRIWRSGPQTAADFTFGWDNQDGTVVNGSQTCAVICLDGTIDSFAQAAAFTVNTSAATAYPSSAAGDGWLVLAVATGQNDDVLTAGPAGFTEVLNNTAGPANERVLAVHSRNVSTVTVDPGASTWSGTTAAHAMFTIAMDCQDTTEIPISGEFVERTFRAVCTGTEGTTLGDPFTVTAYDGDCP